MIGPDVFAVEPWSVAERELRLDLLPQSETIFALSNGHIGLRGNLDEGEPNWLPGTYLNGFFEVWPLPYAEAGYGYPEAGQTMIDVTDGKIIRLLVDDEPFDIRYGTLQRHERVLDMRDGVLRRDVEWISPAGQAVRVRSTRLVSFVQRAVVAILYEVEPIGASARVVAQSVLVANEPVPEQSDDPRAAAALRAPLVSEYHTHHDLEASLGHRTRASMLRMAASMDHIVDDRDRAVTTIESEPDLARVTISTELRPAQTLRFVKLVAYGWSSQRSMPSLRDQVDASLAAAHRTGWEGLLAEQRAYLDDVWDRADVEVEGDPALQQAVRFAMFQVVQAGARAEQRAIPAKGLTGRGYDGHTFWDMETYTLPVLTYIAPHAVRDALHWRHSTLELARTRAQVLGLGGAAFPWRTIRGEECSGYWPAGTAAVHINADIADAVRRYVAATDDMEFEGGAGLELLVETARLWCSVGHHDAEGQFRIDRVTGPDEYSALVDNNVFTNLMAARNLRTAAAVAQRHPDHAVELGVDDDEIVRWRRAADTMAVPFDVELGVTAQSEGFTRYRRWDFDSTRPDQYPLLLHFPYFSLYSSQVIKQADLVFALYACGEYFELEQKARDFEYYERITVRDSSLSAPIQAIVAAEVGHLDLAYDYFGEAAYVDLRDLGANTRDGVHLASLSGAWLVAVAGFGGMRDHGAMLAFAPRLPPDLTRLSFRLLYRGRRLQVDIGTDVARYVLLDGESLELLHHGESVTVAVGSPQSRPWSLAPREQTASSPPGVRPNGITRARPPRGHEAMIHHQNPLSYRHVLVPLDGSELAAAAVSTGRALATRFGADLHTISVANDDKEADRFRAHAAAAAGVDRGDDRVRVVVGGTPVAVIERRTRELEPALVCMSTHGRGRVIGAVIGSVARSLVQRFQDPIVAVGPLAERPPALVSRKSPAPLPVPLSVPRLVACVDGSEASEAVLPVASAWATVLGMSLSIVTVADPAQLSLQTDEASSQGRPDPDLYMARLAEEWRDSAGAVTGEVFYDPISPADGIRAHLDRHPAGLVAVTTHAREGLRRLRLGATAANIVRVSVVPTLVVPLT